MVVTKRAPAPPMPTSRTHSAQSVPRAAQKSHLNDPYNPALSSPLANGKTSPQTQPSPAPNDQNDTAVQKRDAKKSKKSKNRKKAPKGAGSRFFNFLLQVATVGLLVYAAVVCPEDVKHKTAVCRGLSEYKRLVIDPYILPSIQFVLAQPSVAPYVEKVKPVANQAVRITTPVLQRARYEYKYRLVPQWNAHVAPLWDAYAAPQLQRLDANIAPYRAQVDQEYQQRVGVHVDRAMDTMRSWQHKAQPYVVLAAAKTHEGYKAARPYALPVYENIKLYLFELLAFLAEQRRQFVDPHVQKIWERVKELSSGGSKAPPASDMGDYVTSRVSAVASSAVSVASSISVSARASQSKISPLASDSNQSATASDIATASPSLASTVESTSPTSLAVDAMDGAVSILSGASAVVGSGASSILSSASKPAPFVSSSVSSVARSAVPAGSSIVSSYAASISGAVEDAIFEGSSAVSSVTNQLSDTATSVASVAAEHVSHATEVAKHGTSAVSFATSSVADQGASQYSSIADASPASSIVESASSLAAAVTEAPASPVSPNAIADADLAAFYEDLGLADILAHQPSSSEEAPAPVHTETSEQRAAREAQQAERERQRAIENAEKRAELESRHSKWEDDLAAAIQRNRRALRKKLTALREDAVAELKDNKEIKEEIDSLVDEAEKLLRGAEKYLQTLEQESRKEEEKKSLWDRVVDKVDSKFSQRMEQTEAVVNGWYLQVLNKELDEVRRLTEDVKDIADTAQADVGMDWAYLDDVTYNDWQRYHDLVRISDNFTAYASAVQDGSHSSAVPNPILPAIADLQSEVQDVIVGFETRLRRLRRTGERSFSQGVSEPLQSAEDATVSILPVEDSSKVKSPADIDVPPVVMGRSKEEILDALSRVAAHDGDATSPTGPPQVAHEPEGIVQQLVAEVESEDTSVVHEEL